MKNLQTHQRTWQSKCFEGDEGDSTRQMEQERGCKNYTVGIYSLLNDPVA